VIFSVTITNLKKNEIMKRYLSLFTVFMMVFSLSYMWAYAEDDYNDNDDNGVEQHEENEDVNDDNPRAIEGRRKNILKAAQEKKEHVKEVREEAKERMQEAKENFKEARGEVGERLQKERVDRRENFLKRFDVLVAVLQRHQERIGNHIEKAKEFGIDTGAAEESFSQTNISGKRLS